MGFNEILMGFYGIQYMIYGCLSALFFCSFERWVYLKMVLGPNGNSEDYDG